MQAAALARLTAEEADELAHDWTQVARASQLPPPGDWRVWLFLAGRGAGKTRAGAEWVRAQIKAGRRRVALIAPTAADARDVMVEGDSGILSVCWRGDRTAAGAETGMPLYEPSKRRLTWANGALATLYSAEEPERLRGPQHDAAWCDELAAWTRMRDAWDMAMFGLRLGADPRAMVTTTPKPLPLVRELVKRADVAVTRGTTYDNARNLAGGFIDAIRERYAGTRLGRQEIDAEILDDVPGALWTRDMIQTADAPEMARVVVAVDPSGTSGDDGGDMIGIVVAGRTVDGRYHVIEDATCSLSPNGWGRRAVERYHAHRADRIVAERNFGGAMVESVLKAADRSVPVKLVTASRGKAVRADPVALLYEQGRVTHARGLDALEDQLMAFTPSGYMGEGSPDRADALVWALSELALGAQVEARTGFVSGLY